MITSNPLFQTAIIILKGIKNNQTKRQQQKQTTIKNTNTQNQQRGTESDLWGILFPSFCNVSRCSAIFPTRMDLNMCLCCQVESGHPPLSNQALEVARSFNKLLILQGLPIWAPTWEPDKSEWPITREADVKRSQGHREITSSGWKLPAEGDLLHRQHRTQG